MLFIGQLEFNLVYGNFCTKLVMTPHCSNECTYLVVLSRTGKASMGQPPTPQASVPIEPGSQDARSLGYPPAREALASSIQTQE